MVFLGWIEQKHLGNHKGDGGFKILQKEIGGIQNWVEIFQKNILRTFLGVQS